MNMKTDLGIDNGKDGGIVLINEDGNVVESLVMPVIEGVKREFDPSTIYHVLKTMTEQFDSIRCVIEKVQAMPKQGSVSMMSIGYGHGLLIMALTALAIPFRLVGPKEWQREVFKHAGKGDTKQQSVKYARQTQPSVDWRRNERCKIDHDGKTDAYAMAQYAKQVFN